MTEIVEPPTPPLKEADFGDLSRSEHAVANISRGLNENFGLGLDDPSVGRALLRVVHESSADSVNETPDSAEPSGADERLEQWTAGLHLLGYLKRKEAEKANWNSPELERAAAEFRANLADSGEGVVRSGDLQDPDAGPAAPREAELETLARLTSLENDIALPDIPQDGGLHARVLQYRLRMLGLFDFRADGEMDERSMTALAGLRKTLNPLGERGRKASPSEVLRLTGDTPELMKYLLREYIFRPVFCMVDTGDLKPEKARYDKLFVYHGKFREYTWLDEYHNPGAHRAGRAENRARTALAARLYEDYNQLGLRLLQLKLWMYGYYDGLLDGHFGAMSLRGLRHAMRVEGVDPDQAFRRVEHGVLAINPHYLNAQLFELYEEKEPSADALERALRREVTEGRDKTSFWKRIKDGFKRAASGAAKAIRGLYRGIKSLFRSALRALQRGYAWLMEWLSKLGAGIAHLVQAVFGRLREGVRLVIRSTKAFFAFVLGRPVVSVNRVKGEIALSRFHLDADGILIISENASRDFAREHGRRTTAFMRNVAGFARVVTGLVRLLVRLSRLATAGNPISWFLLAFEIARWFRGLMKPRPLAAA